MIADHVGAVACFVFVAVCIAWLLWEVRKTPLTPSPMAPVDPIGASKKARP